MLRRVSAAASDIVLSFSVPALDVRGRIVKLGPMLATILARHAYPPAVSRVLAEAILVTCLFGSNLKREGRFQLQTRSDGAIQSLVVDYETPGHIRAMARFDADKAHAADGSPAHLLGDGHLALTIEHAGDDNRYQGLVALDGQGLVAAADQYFRQSEQIPTVIRVAVAQSVGPEGLTWLGGALMVQFLPSSSDRRRAVDLPPGDAPAGHEIMAGNDDDAWVEARTLAATVEDHELVDPLVSAEDLAYRLFHERGVYGQERLPVLERCRCSRERIDTMLRQFSADDVDAMIGEDGRIGVTCEFCSIHYSFDPADYATR